MRVVRQLPVKSLLGQIYPVKGARRTMTIAVPNTHEKEELDAVCGVMKVKAEPLAAFDKPRLPPVLGPLIVLSAMEMLSNDGDE